MVDLNVGFSLVLQTPDPVFVRDPEAEVVISLPDGPVLRR
jgi:hypothetical protein